MTVANDRLGTIVSTVSSITFGLIWSVSICVDIACASGICDKYESNLLLQMNNSLWCSV